MRKLIGLSLVVGLVFFYSCEIENKTSDEIQKDWLAFETSTYSIKYPKNWALNQSGYMGTSFLLISKQTSIRDFYQENVGLVEEAFGDSTIDFYRYVRHSIEIAKDTVVDFEIKKDTLIDKKEISFQHVIYEGREGINKVTTEKYYFLKDHKAYILTFSGKSLELGRYQPIGEGILNSFQLK